MQKGKGRSPRASNNITKKFAENLSDLIEERRQQGISHKQVSAGIGVSDGALSNWCSDDKTPTIDALAKIAKYFDVSTDWLLGLTDFREQKNNELLAKDIGLTEEAIEQLLFFKENSDRVQYLLPMYNHIVTHKEFAGIVSDFAGVRNVRKTKTCFEQTGEEFEEIMLLQTQVFEATNGEYDVVSSEDVVLLTEHKIQKAFQKIIEDAKLIDNTEWREWL